MELISSIPRRSYVGLSKEKKKVPDRTKVMADEFGDKLRAAGEVHKDGPWKNVSIYKIPCYLMVDPSDRANIPKAVSLGPYHREESHLQQMETHKWRAFERVLKRTGQDKKLYLDSMEKLEAKARACYEGPLDQLDRNQFVEMMLLDGCFILEILQGAAPLDDIMFRGLGYAPDDPIFCMRAGPISFIRRDMIMLENQIPLFVLDELLALQLGSPSKGDVVELALSFLHPLMWNSDPDTGLLKNTTWYEKLKPICAPLEPPSNPADLHSCSESEWEVNKVAASAPEAIYASQEAPSSSVDLHTDSESEFEPYMVGSAPEAIYGTLMPPCVQVDLQLPPNPPHILGSAPVLMHGPKVPPSNQGDLHFLHVFRKRLLKEQTDQQGSNASVKNETKLLIPCVTELKDAGVKFQKRSSDNLWDIKFEKGILKIPPILIRDGTKSLLFNLIAFEQCHLTCSKDITSYVIFLDNLINSAEDVKYLRNHGIIEHWLGSDAEVADLINRLGKEMVFYVNESHFSQISVDINAYYGKIWHTWRAILRERYFNNPWAIISFVAAVLLLIMTAAQVFYAVYTYYWPNN